MLKRKKNKSTGTVLQVALPLPLRQTFDYLLPTEHARVRNGCRVEVPFQKRRLTGLVISSTTDSSISLAKLKPIFSVIDSEPSARSKLLKFLKWAAYYYHHPIGEVINAALPKALRGTQVMKPKLPLRYLLTPAGVVALRSLPSRAKAQRRVLVALERAGSDGILSQDLGRLTSQPGVTLNLLRDRGWLEMFSDAKDYLLIGTKKTIPKLNPAQVEAVHQLKVRSSSYAPFLLQGVTGSGKTEIYLRTAASVVESGYQVLILVPEIALTPQLLTRFQEGMAGKMAVMHSGLTDRERHLAWWAAREGLADVIVGTRSAVFTPLAKPGLYIIDEEHDSSYKQQDGFRYNARDLIVKRAHQDRVPVILGSATPSLESIENVNRGRYRHLLLQQRAGGAAMPDFHILDLGRLPVKSGLTQPVLEALRIRLGRNEQSIVYVNRRGFAPVLLCSACRWQAQCNRCEVRLTLHQRSSRLLCHHCGKAEEPPLNCPKCGHNPLHPIGEGTQRIEDALRNELPSARILRLDSDNAATTKQLTKDLAQVRAGEIDILVGTQLLSKGHDFPSVTLVCILNADGGLYSLDFRAPERFYQQLTQVAGRAGRGSKPGLVLVQTRHPDDISLFRLAKHDFDGFVQAELSQRRMAQCPPFARFALLRADSLTPYMPLEFVNVAAELGRRLLYDQSTDSVQILDPVPSPMERKAGRYRAQLLVTSRTHAPLHHFLRNWLDELGKLKEGRTLRWSLDVDPIEMY